MEILKTKEAAELLSVSLTTIKRWAAMFPDFFPKDRFGHYTFSEQQISQLNHIKDRINQGEALEGINLYLANDKLTTGPLQENPSLGTDGDAMNEIWSRIEYIEHALDQKASEVVSVQLLQQRAELEDMRIMIKQLSASLETIQKPNSTSRSPYEELLPAAAGRLTSPPRKRGGLLRSFFPFL
ncbi:MerR family transcriptional regulator [Paenibacillus borealis]|uniref:MerR family transcriptional regulator n=1 Tax=Paenibacillus borealis TaxID=160799 RepID=UPI0005AB77EB|nr:MerR family transcriptional regulator [Paenibacillus borealis]